MVKGYDFEPLAASTAAESSLSSVHSKQFSDACSHWDDGNGEQHRMVSEFSML